MLNYLTYLLEYINLLLCSKVMHKELSLYYGLVTCILYVSALIGMFVAMLIIHRLISEEKKRDKKAMRGQPNLKRFGNFQGIF